MTENAKADRVKTISLGKDNKRPVVVVIMSFAIFICLIVWLDVMLFDLKEARSTTSVWDLSKYSFETNRFYLNGPVEFIPNALLTPAEFAAREDEAIIGYPQDVSQYATSRLRILLPDDGFYAFSGPSIGYSERLYVNGAWVLDIGVPGESRETTIPDTGNISLTLKAENGMIEIIQQSSNFVQNKGGAHDGWRLTSSTTRDFLLEDFNDGIKLGFFLALFFIHLFIFALLRTYKANLFFALFCLMWFFRSGVTGAEIFSDMIPLLTWVIKIRIEFIAFPVTAMLLIPLLNILFPGILPKVFRWIVVLISAGFAVMFIVADTLFISDALLWFEVMFIVAIIFILVMFVAKLRSMNLQQIIFLAGITIFFFAVIHATFYYNDIYLFYNRDLSPSAMLLLSFCGGMSVFVATMREVERAKEQEKILAVENLSLKDHVRLSDMQLGLQREQFERIMYNAEAVKEMRHDMRHHLAAIGQLADDEHSGKVREYVDKLTGSVNAVQEKAYCTNFAVNAVAVHYLGLAQAEGVAVDAQLVVPEDTGSVPAIDLCIILGNFLENALEACRRMTGLEKFIRVRSRIDGDTISLVVENSFDGLWIGGDGVYYSRKERDLDEAGGADKAGIGGADKAEAGAGIADKAGAGTADVVGPGSSRKVTRTRIDAAVGAKAGAGAKDEAGAEAHEGIGISSVRTVCEKHRGLVDIDIKGDVWKSSALVHM